MQDATIAPWTYPVEQALPIGTVLCGDQFTITGHLGAGGFGITYLAQDVVLGRPIVIKECFPESFCVRDGTRVRARNSAYAGSVRSIVEMFMREARSLARLRHPNIVGVHRAFEENETAYMALDLIDGPDLLEILQSEAKPFEPARVREILLQLLDAIEQVHEIDLLHRDISPDNIIIDKTGTPVLIDFGAARADASRRTRAASSMLVVKDGYSPQEFYISGSKQAPSSDLYGLAATFYHVLSGEAPPDSQTRMLEIAGRRPDPCVPLAGRIEGYDEAFLKAIDQAMQIHPDDRLQSAVKWRALIAEDEAEERPAARARKTGARNVIDMEFRRSLSRLVEETNVEVGKSRLLPVAAKTVAPLPKVVPKPDWIEEFNQETEALAAERALVSRVVATAQDAALAEAAPEEIAGHDGTDWIERAREKQSRLYHGLEDVAPVVAVEEPPVAETAAEPEATVPEIPPGTLSAPVPGADATEQAPPEPAARPHSRPARIVAGLLLCASFAIALVMTGAFGPLV